jgi:hypothetical protein
MDEMSITHYVREKKNAYTCLVGKPEERGHLDDLGCRLDDDTKMDLE